LSEISVALLRGISVIPVLVDGAAMPRLEDLPESLKALTRRNAVELRNSQFGADANRLIGKIKEVLEEEGTRRRQWGVLVAVVAGVITLGLSAWAFIRMADLWHGLFGRTSAVESCDRTLGPAAPDLEFSGVFAGVIVDGAQSGAEVQLKLVRNGDLVR